jgi:hypothetical protein
MLDHNDNVLTSKRVALNDIYLVVLIVYLHNIYFGSFNIVVNKLDTLKEDRAEHIAE